MGVIHKVNSIIGINKKKEEEEEKKFTAMEDKITELEAELAMYKEEQDTINKDLNVLAGVENE